MTLEELLEEADNYVRFVNPSFDKAIIGISHDDRLVYDYELMVKDYTERCNCDVEEAIEWIAFNTIRSLPYNENSPIIIKERVYKNDTIEDRTNENN